PESERPAWPGRDQGPLGAGVDDDHPGGHDRRGRGLPGRRRGGRRPADRDDEAVVEVGRGGGNRLDHGGGGRGGDGLGGTGRRGDGDHPVLVGGHQPGGERRGRGTG